MKKIAISISIAMLAIGAVVYAGNTTKQNTTCKANVKECSACPECPECPDCCCPMCCCE